jgi:dUTPase
MFFTPPLFVWTAAFSDVQLDLCFPRPEAASSSASCSFKTCRTGLNVKLPSGVVGAVEISSTPSSGSMLEEGIEGCLYMVAIEQRSDYEGEQRWD